MIVFNTNQFNNFGLKNKTQQHSTLPYSQFTEKVKHPNNVNGHSSELTYSQQNVNQISILSYTSESRASEPHYFKQQFSLLATFAIQQYETLANFEAQQTRTSILGINEYA